MRWGDGRISKKREFMYTEGAYKWDRERTRYIIVKESVRESYIGTKMRKVEWDQWERSVIRRDSQRQ